MAPSGPSIDRLSSIGPGGARSFLHPARSHGRFTRWRQITFAVLIAFLTALPFVTINGRPGVWLDLGRRNFHILGLSVGPTEGYLLFFFVALSAFALLVVTALWGRVWCGWACPQTVWLEGVYRPIERFFEGDRNQQLRLDAAPWGFDKAWRKGGKNLAFFLVSALIAHLLTCYFIPPRTLWEMMGKGPKADPEVFVWTAAITTVVFFNFAWFREQFCIILCPYGRLQSVLADQDTVVVGYDGRRGEPRGKVGEAKGDCIDCSRCVAVCPTGIDIRQGLQLECVGCAACIDACDGIMAKVGRKPGLIRYDSQRVLAGGEKRFLRPRVYAYLGLGLLLIGAAVFTTRARPELPITLVRQAGAPFVLEGAKVRNAYLLRTWNRSEAEQSLTVEIVPSLGSATVTLPQKVWTVAPGANLVIPVFVETPRQGFAGPFDVKAHVANKDGREVELHARFLGPDQ